MLIIGSAEIVGVLALPDVQPEEKLATFWLMLEGKLRFKADVQWLF